MRQANTTFVNLRAALDDLDPLVETAKPATKNLAPVPGRTAPGPLQIRPLHPQPAPDRRQARARPTTPPNCWRRCRPSSSGPRGRSRTPKKRSPPSSPTSTSSAPTRRTSSTALGKLGQVAGYYDGNGHYVRAATAAQNLFAYEGGTLKPITKGQQYDAFGSSAPVRRRCPGGATQPAPDGSNPFVDPPSAAAASAPPNATRPTRPPDHDPAADNRGSAGRGRGRGRPARLRRRQQQRRLHGPRDLRQRRLHGQRRAGAGRRRQRRHDRVGRRLDAGRDRRLPRRRAGRGPRQGDHRDENHRPRLPGLPQRRQLPDPPAVADRREVRRLPPDPAAGAGLAAAAAAEGDPRRARRAPASTCCRSAATAPASTRT